MELYILTCTDESGAIVLLEVYPDMHKAHWAMVDDHNKKEVELAEAGHFKNTFNYMDLNSATAGDDQVHYRWNIHYRRI